MEQLRMTRDASAAEAPRFPAGYVMRPFQPGDEQGWCACCIDGELGVSEISKDQFDKIMMTDERVKPENIFMLIAPDGQAAGTVTYQLGKAEHEGYIHMVGLDKRFWGQKLSLPMMLYAIARIKDAGKTLMVLTTDDWRHAAIKTYLRAGFTPAIAEGDAETVRRWAEVIKAIGG